MKKSFLCLIAFLSMAISAQAGDVIQLGVMGGYNLTAVNFKRGSLDNTLIGKNGSGWYLGPKDLASMPPLFTTSAAIRWKTQ